MCTLLIWLEVANGVVLSGSTLVVAEGMLWLLVLVLATLVDLLNDGGESGAAEAGDR